MLPRENSRMAGSLLESRSASASLLHSKLSSNRLEAVPWSMAMLEGRAETRDVAQAEVRRMLRSVCTECLFVRSAVPNVTE